MTVQASHFLYLDNKAEISPLSWFQHVLPQLEDRQWYGDQVQVVLQRPGQYSKHWSSHKSKLDFWWIDKGPKSLLFPLHTTLHFEEYCLIIRWHSVPSQHWSSCCSQLGLEHWSYWEHSNWGDANRYHQLRYAVSAIKLDCYQSAMQLLKVPLITFGVIYSVNF